MQLDEVQKEKLRTLTVEVILDLYIQAIRSGWNPLDLWDQVSNRIRAAANVTVSPEEWFSKLLRDLKQPGPSKDASGSILALSHAVREQSSSSAWLELVTREHGLLVAMARKIREERQAKKQGDYHVG